MQCSAAVIRDLSINVGGLVLCGLRVAYYTTFQPLVHARDVPVRMALDMPVLPIPMQSFRTISVTIFLKLFQFPFYSQMSIPIPAHSISRTTH